jgi:hypothetical protein
VLSLNLSGNNIGSSGMSYIYQIMTENSYIEEYVRTIIAIGCVSECASNCWFVPMNYLHVHEQMRYQRYYIVNFVACYQTKLFDILVSFDFQDLSFNNLCKSGVSKLADAVPLCSQLKVLSIAGSSD